MSALTNLFTSLANKIRSKTGGSDTYTPPQMVAAIDDVYDAGVAAGTKPTQTKSAGPNVSTNKDVTPDSGYLLSKVTITPLSHTGTYTPAANTAANDMGQYHDKRYVNTSGMIIPTGNKSITANGTGIDVSGYATASVNVPNPTLSGDATTSDVLSGKTFYSDSYTKKTGTYTAPTITSITPSNTSPVSMSANNNYKPTASGYAISSYSSVTPSSSGASFSSGMVKMDGNGYAYSSRPSSGYNYGWNSSTLLWNNGSSTSSFAAQTITLSQAFTNFRYIRIVFNAATSKTTQASIIVTKEDLQNSLWSDNTKPLVSFSGRAPSANAQFTRRIVYVSATQLQITDCYQFGAATTNNSSTIPLYIYGLT
ncbi:MAG: hypothetical protein J6U56_05275 [Spirochaetia bacterium]|nr:hypothetical protein [Spirochaetia bacterium]